MPRGGVYIRKSKVTEALWSRLSSPPAASSSGSVRGATARSWLSLSPAAGRAGTTTRRPGRRRRPHSQRCARRRAVLVRRSARIRAGGVPGRQLKAGSRPTSSRSPAAAPTTRDRQRDGGDAGEPVPGRRPISLPARVARARPERCRRAAVTPLALGAQAGFELVADTATAEATGPHDLPRAAIGQVVWSSSVTSVGARRRTRRAPATPWAHRAAADAPAAPPAADAPATEDGCPYSFDVPAGFRPPTPPSSPRTARWCTGVARRPLVGEPGAGVLVRRGPPGRRSTRPRSATSSRRSCRAPPDAGRGRTIAGLPGVRCGATAFTDTAGHPVPTSGRRVRHRPRHPPDGGALLLDRRAASRGRGGLRERAGHAEGDGGGELGVGGPKMGPALVVDGDRRQLDPAPNAGQRRTTTQSSGRRHTRVQAVLRAAPVGCRDQPQARRRQEDASNDR